MSTATPTTSANRSLAESMSWLNADERTELIASLTEHEADDLLHDWRFWARPSQLPPPDPWRTWAYVAGRGAGKTRAGAEWVHARMMAGCRRLAMVAPTSADARDVMVEGESGVLAVAHRYGVPLRYEPSKRRVTWPNGGVAFTYSAEEPDRLRGPQHEAAYCDELAAWERGEDTWSNLLFGLRLGPDPRVLATTTPRPIKLLRELLAQPSTAITRSTTYENLANLSPAYRDVIARWEGTRLGRQELEGELLDDVDGALWSLATIDTHRLAAVPAGIDLSRIVVGVDPPATSTGAECGIVVVARGSDGRGYVLDDRSRRGSPNEWANAVVACFDTWEADAVVIEVNQGGDMATNTLKTVRRTLPIREVHASRGKATRAQPVAALYEQGRVSHVGSFPALEDQMTQWVPGDESPDRLDAAVYAVTETVVDRPRKLRVF